MKKKWIALTLFSITAVLLAGCDNPLLIFDPKGPQARTLSNTILFSIAMMAGILFVVYVLYTVVLVKYRASKMDEDYEPPHEEGNKWLEIIWTTIPVILVIVLSFVTVSSTSTVEQKQSLMQMKSHLSSMLLLLTGNGISAIQKKESKQ